MCQETTLKIESLTILNESLYDQQNQYVHSLSSKFHANTVFEFEFMMVTHKTQENTDGHGWTEEQKDGWRQSHNVMVTGEGKNSLTECKKKKRRSIKL